MENATATSMTARRGRLPDGVLAHGGMRNPIRRALVKAGGIDHVHAVLSVAMSTIFGWLRARSISTTTHAVQLSLLSGVPVGALSGITAIQRRNLLQRHRALRRLRKPRRRRANIRRA